MQDIDATSLENARRLFESGEAAAIETGTAGGLRHIHARLFGGLCPFAGRIRTENIAKGHFRFANCRYLGQTLAAIGTMPDATFDEIMAKYVEMNIAHPFLDGNGRARRIWLDLLLNARLGRIVRWQDIDREAYLRAMEHSPADDRKLRRLLRAHLDGRIGDLELVFAGLAQSWRFEGCAT